MLKNLNQFQKLGIEKGKIVAFGFGGTVLAVSHEPLFSENTVERINPIFLDSVGSFEPSKIAENDFTIGNVKIRFDDYDDDLERFPRLIGELMNHPITKSFDWTKDYNELMKFMKEDTDMVNFKTKTIETGELALVLETSKIGLSLIQKSIKINQLIDFDFNLHKSALKHIKYLNISNLSIFWDGNLIGFSDGVWDMVLAISTKE